MSDKKNNYENPFDRFFDDFHLPLDWNEELSLEDYLESLDEGKES